MWGFKVLGVQGRTDIPDSVGMLLEFEFEVQFDEHIAKTFAASLVWYILWNVYIRRVCMLCRDKTQNCRDCIAEIHRHQTVPYFVIT